MADHEAASAFMWLDRFDLRSHSENQTSNNKRNDVFNYASPLCF